MGSEAITLAENPATIESDTAEAVITKNFVLMQGKLLNLGPSDVWGKTSVSGAASGVVITGAQAQHQFLLPVGESLDWLPHYASVAHKTTAGAAQLVWMPYRRVL